MSNNYWENFGLDSGGVKKVEGIPPSYFHHQRYVKDTFKRLTEKALQDCQLYAFIPQSRDYTGVWVTVSFPYEKTDFPVVVVDSLPGGNRASDLQHFIRDLYDDFGNIIGERYGGLIESNLTITVYAKSTIERDEIADIVHYGALQSKKRALESQGIVIPFDGIRVENESEEDFGTDKIYSLTIGINLFSHWYSDTMYEHITEIRVDEPATDGPDNNPGWVDSPPNGPIILEPPNAPPRELSPRMAAFLEGAPCCGSCGGFVVKENTGPNPDSRFARAAKEGLICYCGN